MELEKVYDPKKVEDRIYRFWLKISFFNPDRLPKRHKKPFSIVIPPPNVTGELHMGHALNAICQDILIRKKRMEGFKTLWLPGIDHAGIATQNVVEKQLKKEGKTRFDLGREKFIERIWQWVKKYEEIIEKQFQKLGCSLDWSRKRFTLDKEYSKAVETAFLYYLKRGLIYRGKRPVNWCPECQTSLSDLEIEYQKEKGLLYYIKYPLKNQKPKTKNQREVVVATTRPETMLGDVALAVNPRDKRYKNLISKKAILPLVKRELPILANILVDPNFGTGIVKITPAHDFRDYEISLKNKLSLIQVIDEKGKIGKEAPQEYHGLTTFEAREKIVEKLKEKGFLEKIEDYEIPIPKCYRCQTTLEVIPSEQWFLRMEKLAKKAEKVVEKGKIKFYPKRFIKIYFDWLKNIRDWCISRQIWWGHQLPVWLCQTGRNPKSQIPNPKPKERYFISLEKPEKCSICGECQPKQISDVLDTWFSSALWPFATLGWPKQKIKNQKSKIKNDLKRFYPTDVLFTDRGIINLWVARMIFSGIEFMRKPPFKKVYIHPTVLTREGKRMSKSLGTGIDPMKLIENYGADATRWGIVWQVIQSQDIKFMEENIIGGRKFCNKIWNASRFVLLQIGDKKFQIPKKIKPKSEIDRKILKELKITKKLVNKYIENFLFGKAARVLYNFFWHNFCDKYIEDAKLQIANCKLQIEKMKTQKILLYVLLNSLKLLHPFLPFITEEIYQKLPIKNKKISLMIEEW